ncbi:MAG: aminoacyl-tRNA hydrolase [Candidatus Pacebacteria bacterium]|nr:aminoacyl-tRNA hydrolase [Candidatus Paceibacterota bacterium]
MKFLLIGLGNPGPEYEYTRHNIGRMAVSALAEALGAAEWEHDKLSKGYLSKTKLGKHEIILSLPETFMNKSGFTAGYLMKAKSIKPENVVVLYDDMDLPHGLLRMAFDRGSGGHRGVESVIKGLKTKAFVRVRIGVSPQTPGGKTKKPNSEEKVLKFLLGKMKDDEKKDFKKIFKRIHKGLEIFFEEGREKAMNVVNTGK